jgi:hypothetical protein
MATTQVYDSPTFSRITSKGRPTSWTLGVPITIVVVALIGLFAYFASKASSLSSQVDSANQQLAQQQQGFAAVQQKLTQNEAELAIAHNPGVATVILQPTKDSNGAWASAVLGEAGSKGFVQVRGYGLKSVSNGKAYQVWFQAAGDDKPVLVGILDPGPDGAAFAQGKDLPSMAKGGRAFVNVGDEKATSVNGSTLLEAKLEPAAKADKKAKDEQ